LGMVNLGEAYKWFYLSEKSKVPEISKKSKTNLAILENMISPEDILEARNRSVDWKKGKVGF